VEHVGRHLDAKRFEPVQQVRPHSTDLEVAKGVSFLIYASLIEAEQVVKADCIAFHARDLTNRDDLSLPPGETAQVNQDVEGRTDLIADRMNRKVQAGHTDHILKSSQGVAGAVRVYGGHGALVTGVHGLKHVKSFAATNLANDDPVRSHAQAVPQQIPLRDLALALEVGRARLQADDVRLL